MSEETPCKYCGHWPDPADDFAYVAVCNGQTFCGEPVCKGKCYQCRISKTENRLATLEAQLHDIREIYAGMEGFEPETAPEGYCLRIIEQMYNAAIPQPPEQEKGDE